MQELAVVDNSLFIYLLRKPSNHPFPAAFQIQGSVNRQYFDHRIFGL